MGVECPGKCWLVIACDGLRWLVLARPGSFCLVLSRCGSLWLVVARSRLPWLVPACPGQIWRPNSTTLMSWWPSAFWRLSFALALTESIVSRAASISGKFHQKSTTSTGACQNVDFPPLKLHGLCTPVWHVCCVASNKAPRRVTSQANTSSHGSIWLVLACPALSCVVLACPGLFWLVLAFPGSSWLVLACTDKIWRSKCHHSDEVVAKHISGALICSGAYGTSRFSSDVDFWEISPKKYYNQRCLPEH